MKAREIMTADPACCTPQDSVRRATEMMAERDCGALPVVEDSGSRRLVGVVTDRDVALRAVARGNGPDTLVSEVMSASPSCCGPDDDLSAVERIMADKQVRRVPVVDDAGCCVGMIAQADLARDERGTTDQEVRRVVERISESGQRSPGSDDSMR